VLRKIMVRLATAMLVDGNFYNYLDVTSYLLTWIKHKIIDVVNQT
jgi:hypothetical protein